MEEKSPSVRFEDVNKLQLDLETALSLAHHFFLAASGILDLFDPSWFTSQLSVWIQDPSQTTRSKLALIYLTLATGAQSKAQNESQALLAEQCHAYGRHLATTSLMDDPNLLTVQAFTLIAYYMIAACRRNAVFTNLGVAVRAAYALGIHLHDTNIAFVHEQGMLRERAWKSLRVCDLFFSSSMGRPPATSEAIYNIPYTTLELDVDRESSSVASQCLSAIFKICDIFERILIEVYSKKAVTLEIARSISKQHREWTEELPRTLKIDGLEVSDVARCPGMSPSHGSSLVTMAYYYSIVLLTRPFLVFPVSNRCSQALNNSSVKADLTTYANACVDLAIKGIDIAYDYVFVKYTSKRQPFATNSVFLSIMCLGLAYLDDYDQQRWPLSRALERGIAILTHLGQLDDQAARSADICRLLKDSVSRYVDKRDDLLLHANNSSVRNVFGDVRAPGKSMSPERTIAHANQLPPCLGWNIPPNGMATIEPISPASFDSSILQWESMIPTSGIFPAQAASMYHTPYPDSSGMGLLLQHCLTTTGAGGPLDGPAFEQDASLLGLAHDVASGPGFW